MRGTWVILNPVTNYLLAKYYLEITYQPVGVLPWFLLWLFASCCCVLQFCLARPQGDTTPLALSRSGCSGHASSALPHTDLSSCTDPACNEIMWWDHVMRSCDAILLQALCMIELEIIGIMYTHIKFNCFLWTLKFNNFTVWTRHSS